PQDLSERPGAQLRDRQAALLDGLRLGHRAAAERAQKVVEEPLPGGGVVEDVAHERRLAGLLDEVAQARRGGVEALEEEGEDSGVSRRELRRMQIPALVESALE